MARNTRAAGAKHPVTQRGAQRPSDRGASPLELHGREDEGKSPEQLYQEREKRFADAIELRAPDRVPVRIGTTYFAARYAGVTCEAAFYEPEKWKWACRKTIQELKPDVYTGVGTQAPGPVLEALGTKQMKWPGYGVPANHCHQFVEGEYMKEDEYDALLADPSDFTLRTYLPRVFGAMGAFSRFPSFKTFLSGTIAATMAGALAAEEFQESFAAISRAVTAARAWRSAMGSFDDEMAGLGFPASSRAASLAPFDLISDNLRGMKGTMIDMYRRPDKLLQACEMLLPVQIERAVAGSRGTANKRVFIPLHRGAEGFLSVKQFETFYWPTLKGLMLALVEKGLVPCPFFEGHYESRLEYLLELPRGKVLCHFEHMDMARAKEVLGGHLCLMGNVPSSLLQIGTVPEVEEHCKKLIEVAGKGGGFVLAPGSSIDEAKPENIKAMIDSVMRWGWY